MGGTFPLSPSIFCVHPQCPNILYLKPVKAVVSGNPRLLLQPGNVMMEEIPEAESNRCAFWHGSKLRTEMHT